MVIARILEHAGHQLKLVENGQEVLDALEQEKFDLVIVDKQMPEVGGIDAYKIYRFAHPDNPPLPFIMLTANATIDARKECEDAGIEHFLTKPGSSSKLLRTLNKATAHLQIPSVGPERSNAESDTVETDQEALIDQAILDEIIALAPSEAFLYRLLDNLDNESDQLLHGMSEAAAKQDIPRFKDLIHSLKGSAINLGLRRLYNKALAIERLSDTELITEAEHHIATLAGILEKDSKALHDAVGYPKPAVH